MNITTRIDISHLSAPKQQALMQARDAYEVVRAIGGDGEVDAQEMKILDELVLQLKDQSAGELQFENAQGQSKALGFDAGIRDDAVALAQDIQKVNRLRSRSHMKVRAEHHSQVDNLQSLRGVLQADEATATEMRENLGPAARTDAKILLQDAFLIERAGLLSLGDKLFVEELGEQLHTQSINHISREDITRLDAMVDGVIAQLNGDESLQFLRVDEQALQNMNVSDYAQAAANAELVEDNLDALMSSSDAVVHDLLLSTQEVDLSRYQLNQLNNRAEVRLGRSFPRMTLALEEVEKQIFLLEDKAMPALQNRFEGLKQELQARELALAELSPEARAQDPVLQLLRQQIHSLTHQYEHLAEKLNLLSDTRVHGLEKMQDIRELDAQMRREVQQLQNMSADLAEGSQRLEQVQHSIETLPQNRELMYEALRTEVEYQVQRGTFLESSTASAILTLLDSAEAAAGGLTELLENPMVQQFVDGYMSSHRVETLMLQEKIVANLEDEIDVIQDEMVSGMESLIDNYSSGGGKAEVLDLLNAELASLKTLSASDYDDAEGRLQALAELRDQIVERLQPLVPSHMTQRELDAIQGLDNSVTQYSTQYFSTASDTESMQAAVAQQLERAIEERASRTATVNHVLEDMLAFDKAGGEVSLAYGSHAQVYLGFGAGAGGKLGDDNFNLTAKLGLALEASMTVEKAFGQGPAWGSSYLLHLDLEAQIKGELGLQALFLELGVNFEAALGVRGGLAFGSVQQIEDFGALLTETLALAEQLNAAPGSEQAELQTQLETRVQAIAVALEQHAYTGESQRASAQAEAGVEVLNVLNLAVSSSAQKQRDFSYFSDQTVVQDDVYTWNETLGLGLGVEAGPVELSYSSAAQQISFTGEQQISTLLVNAGEAVQQHDPHTRGTFKASMPGAPLVSALDPSSDRPFSELKAEMDRQSGGDFSTHFYREFRQLNTEIQLTDGEIDGLLNQALAGQPELLAKMKNLVILGGDDVTLVLGVNRTQEGADKAPQWTVQLGVGSGVELGVEASAKYFYAEAHGGYSTELSAAIQLNVQENP